MSELKQLEFPVWNQPLPPPPRMTPEQYDRFLYETLFRGNRTTAPSTIRCQSSVHW
ncbi:MAG: hypothetical protein PHI93_09695 [Kiritimatiellae bacterium]|jgi:hypothetical protein|nr:hypothetical protein [Kiritimatiellia bacterium]